jgi:hypothetical protein
VVIENDPIPQQPDFTGFSSITLTLRYPACIRRPIPQTIADANQPKLRIAMNLCARNSAKNWPCGSSRTAYVNLDISKSSSKLTKDSQSFQYS